MLRLLSRLVHHVFLVCKDGHRRRLLAFFKRFLACRLHLLVREFGRAFASRLARRLRMIRGVRGCCARTVNLIVRACRRLFCCRLDWRSFSSLLTLDEGLVQKVEVLVVDEAGLWKDGLDRHSTLLGPFCREPKLLVALEVVFLELVFRQVEGLAEFDGDFLLLQENEFVVLHVLLRVGLQVGAQLVQVQTVFVVALLVVQEELTELGRAERRPDHAVVEHELVH